MNAKAKDGSGDERLVALGEIERFDPRPGVNDPSALYLPTFERVYLNAIYGISQALTSSGYGPFRDKKKQPKANGLESHIIDFQANRFVESR